VLAAAEVVGKEVILEATMTAANKIIVKRRPLKLCLFILSPHFLIIEFILTSL
jgi:hypothetical protein